MDKNLKSVWVYQYIKKITQNYTNRDKKINIEIRLIN